MLPLEPFASESVAYPELFGRALPELPLQAPHAFGDLHPRVLAHLGDGVYELLAREWVLLQHPKASVKVIHQESSRLACARFQVTLLNVMLPHLSPAEAELLRRARNVTVAVGRKHQQGLHRLSTSFEALLGLWYLQTPERFGLLKESVWQVANLSPEAFETLAASFQAPLPVAEPKQTTPPAVFQNLKKK
jgi:ribonuclease-3 family protein